jgi:crotonobetainyl-CoA:carnitine CoA-transferase CaiB-like acyl-CoA transferase
LTLEPRQWENLIEFLGHPDWATPEQFRDPARYGPELNRHLREWFSQHPKAWLYHEGQAHGVPLAPYYTPAEVFHSSQQRARGFYVSVDHPQVGCYDYSGLPFQCSETPPQTGRAPLLGEHNRLIYQELGYSPQDMVDLARGGAI